MYQIEKHHRKIDGISITTFSRQIANANVLEVEAGSTGYCGGDSGHGSKTYIKLQDLSCTDIRVNPIGHAGDRGVEITLSGDSELSTIIEALKFIRKALNDAAVKRMND